MLLSSPVSQPEKSIALGNQPKPKTNGNDPSDETGFSIGDAIRDTADPNFIRSIRIPADLLEVGAGSAP